MLRSRKIKKRRLSRHGGGMPVSNSWELGQVSSRKAQQNMESLINSADKKSQMALDQAFTLQAATLGSDNPKLKNNIDTVIQQAAIATERAYNVKHLPSISPDVKKEIAAAEEKIKSQTATATGTAEEQLRIKADAAKTLTGTLTGNSKFIGLLNNVKTVPPLWTYTIKSTFDSAAKRSPQELANLAATYLNAVTTTATNKYPKHLADIIVSTPLIAICIASQVHRYEAAISMLNSKNPLVRDTLAKYLPAAAAPSFVIQYTGSYTSTAIPSETLKNFASVALTLTGKTDGLTKGINGFTSVPLTQQSQADSMLRDFINVDATILTSTIPQRIADRAATYLNTITSRTKYPKSFADIIVATPLIAMIISTQASRFPEAIAILTNANPRVQAALAEFIPVVAATPFVINYTGTAAGFQVGSVEEIPTGMVNRCSQALTLIGLTGTSNTVIDNFTSVPLTQQSQANNLLLEFSRIIGANSTPQSIANTVASCLNKITASTQYPKNLADVIVVTPLVALAIATQASRFPEAISILTTANPAVQNVLAEVFSATPSTGGYKYSRHRGGAPPGFAEGQIVSQSKRLQSLAEARAAAATAELAKSQASNLVAATVGAKPNSLQSTLPRLAYTKAEEATRMASAAQSLTAPFQGVRNAANGETPPGTELGMGAEIGMKAELGMGAKDGRDEGGEEGPSVYELASTVIGNPNLENPLAQIDKLNTATPEELPGMLPYIVDQIVFLTRQGHLVVADVAATYLHALKTYKDNYPVYFAKMIMENTIVQDVIATQIIDYKEEVRFLETVSLEAAQHLRMHAPPEVVIQPVDVSREPQYRTLIRSSFLDASKSIGDIRQNVTYIRKLDVLQEGEANIIYSNVIFDFLGAIRSGGQEAANITATYLNAVNIYTNNYPKHFINIIRSAPSIMACIEAKRGDYEAEVRNLETINPLLTTDLDSVEQILGLNETVSTVLENRAIENAKQQFQRASTITGNTHGSILHIRKLNRTEDADEIAKITSYIINDFIASTYQNAESVADIAAVYLSYLSKVNGSNDYYPLNIARIIQNNYLLAICISTQKEKYPEAITKLIGTLSTIRGALEFAEREARAFVASRGGGNTSEGMTGGYRKIRLTRRYRKKRKSTRRTKKRKNRKGL